MNNNGRQSSNYQDANHHGGEVRGTDAGSKTIAGAEAQEILASVGEALYRWDIDSDVLSWSANAADVLLIRDRAASPPAALTRNCSSKTAAQARFDAVMQSEQRDDGRGVSYRIQYRIRPDPGEDTVALGRRHRPLVCRPGRQAGARSWRHARHQ